MTHVSAEVRGEKNRWATALAQLGDKPDAEIDLAETALILAAYTEALDDITPYRQALAGLGKALQAVVDEKTTLAEATTRTLDIRVSALQEFFGTRLNYQGDVETYDDLSNALLTHVLDRRKGLPVSLGILFIHAARLLGWKMEGLHFPGHFLIRLEVDGLRRILDPFAGGMPVEIGEDWNPKMLRIIIHMYLGF